MLDDLLRASPWLSSTLVVLVTTLGLLAVRFILRPSLPQNAPYYVRGWPLLGCLDFFWRRTEFLHAGKAKSPNGQFSFYYGPLPIVALSGLDARSAFFMARGLDLNEG